MISNFLKHPVFEKKLHNSAHDPKGHEPHHISEEGHGGRRTVGLVKSSEDHRLDVLGPERNRFFGH